MNSKKKFSVALSTIAFALVVASPVGAVCSISTLSECDNNGLIAVITQLMGGSQTTTTTTTTTTGTTAIAACQGITSFDRNLTVGSSGADVKCLQALLNQSADTQVAATGVGSAGNETTYFGSKTTAAVMAYQTKNAISPVAGYVGPITRASLNAALTASTTTGTGTGTTTTYPAGCTSSTGYSPTTGQACSGTTTTTTYPAGCTSATGYSPTTGQACSATTTTATGAALTVALASDTPAGGNVLKGEANKSVTRVILTAGADADAVVNTIKVKAYGTADLNAADITAVKIFDNGSQVGTTQSLIAGNSIFTLSPSLTITKGTSKVLDIVVSVNSIAGVSGTVKMGIENAASIGGTVLGGTYPVVGNAYTIVAGGSLGTVSVAAGTLVPVTSVGSGTANVELGNFLVSAGTNENVKINQFVVGYLGTTTNSAAGILDTDVTNIRVSVDGVVQGTAVTFASRKATVNFATPITITKGSSKIFKVIGDVSSGTSRNIELQAGIDSVSGVGETSGVGVAGPANAFALGTSNMIVISRGTLSASVSSSSPQGTAAQYVKSTTAQTLGVFDIRATGEDILLSSLGIKIVGSGSPVGSITNVGLYNEAGSLISGNTINLAAADWTTPGFAATNYFTLSTTIPANTTQKFYVKGITNGITGPDPVSITVSLLNNLTGTVSIIGTGMNSSAQEGSYNVTLNSTLALPAVSVNQGPTASLSADPLATPLDQAIMIPASQITVGTLKVTAQREDQTLRSLTLTGVVVGTGNVASTLSQVALYDGVTQVTQFVTPATNNVVFLNSDLISPAVTFVKGTAKTLRIVANTLGTATAGDTIYFTVPATFGAFTSIGKDSSQLFQSASATLLTTGTGATVAGTYTVEPVVIEMTKDAASPSGTVGRGTFLTYATWDLNSFGTTANRSIDTITFYSKVGLPTGADNTMFRLIDTDTGTAILSATPVVTPASGTVAFDITTTDLTIVPGVTKRISLQITTTNATVWAASTAMQWSVIPAGYVTFVGATDIGIGSSSGLVYSIPADTNLVNIGQ
ncbi:MAG: peptidoglycan-binding domain-containing protein [Candidatus Paceibacterota bacterium]|jgi:hypothetical protein